MSLIKALYIVAIGLLITAFIGFGIETFYPTPKSPEYPSDLNYQTEKPSKEVQQKQVEFEKTQKSFQKKLSSYNQNVSVIAIILSIVLLAASIIGLSKLEIIGDGLTLGGVFTLFYGIVRAFSTEEAVFRFIAVSAALLIMLSLTYWRFLRPQIKVKAIK